MSMLVPCAPRVQDGHANGLMRSAQKNMSLERRRSLIRCWMLDAVDDEHVHRRVRGLELEAKLLL